MTYQFQGFRLAKYNDVVVPVPPPEAVTIDKFEIQLDYATNMVNSKVTLTNKTGKTLISRPLDWIYTHLRIDAWDKVAKREVLWWGVGMIEIPVQLPILFATTATSGIGDIPPGRTIKEFSYKPSFPVEKPNLEASILEGTGVYVDIHFWQVDQRPMEYIYGADVHEYFEGVLGSSWRTLSKTDKRPVIVQYTPAPWVYPYPLVIDWV